VLIATGLVTTNCGSSHLTLADLTGPSGTGPITSTTSTSALASTPTSMTPRAASDTTDTSPATTGTWTPATANLASAGAECGSVSLVSARTDRDTVLAGVTDHGLWSMDEGADSWRALGQGPGSAAITNRVSNVVYDPTRPNTFWESGIYNGGGVYRTDDGGASFQQLGSISHVDAVSVDLSDPARKTLVAGLHEQTAVMRSTDGGQSWTKISGTLPAGVGFTSSPYVIDAQTYLIGTNHENNAGVFHTTDGGVTWTQVSKGAVLGQPLRTSDGHLFWVVDGGGVIASADGGLTWTTAARAGSIDAGAPFLVEVAARGLAAIGRTTVTVSTDGGSTWHNVGPTMPYRPAGLAYSPSRKIFYIWSVACDRADNTSPSSTSAGGLPADTVMQLDVSSA
jgi:photosystem II stability/assembly factor-like uncharacterized protein